VRPWRSVVAAADRGVAFGIWAGARRRAVDSANVKESFGLLSNNRIRSNNNFFLEQNIFVSE